MNNWIPENLARNPSETHITIAMSGGVDSSVTALLVKEAGFSCSGLFMKNWNEVDSNDGCRWEEDVEDALNVCETLDIPLNTIDLSKEYWENVFTLFLKDRYVLVINFEFTFDLCFVELGKREQLGDFIRFKVSRLKDDSVFLVYYVSIFINQISFTVY